MQKETASKSGRLKLRIHQLVENEDLNYFMRRTWTHKNPYRAIVQDSKKETSHTYKPSTVLQKRTKK